MRVRFWFRSKNELYPFEIRVVEAIKSRLKPNAAVLLQRQVDCINEVQRLTQGKEINLYRVAHGKPAFDDTLRFPGAEGEMLLATVHLADPNGTATLKAEGWLANGRLFSLLFDKPPKRFFAGQDLQKARPEVASVILWADPMLGPEKATEAPADAPLTSGWPRDYLLTFRFADPRAPVVGPRRAAMIARVNSQLPHEYLELTEQVDGARSGDCVIHGLAGIRKVSTLGDAYYILAETQSRGLAVKEEDQSGQLYSLSYDSGDIVSLSRSFKAALVEFCGAANHKLE